MPILEAFDLNGTLKRLDGDRVLFRELIAFFLEDSAGVLNQLESALQEGNLAASERAAHSMKGLTANVGSGPACLLAARIEDNARQKSLKDAIAVLPELKLELARLREALEQFRAAPDPPND